MTGELRTADEVRAALAAASSPERAAGAARFFKTGPGEYAEGDVFIGVTVPATRAIVRRSLALPAAETAELVASPIHEERLAGLLVMVERFRRAGRPRGRDDAVRRAEHEAYLEAVRAGRVDNWDLVDASAEVLVGEIVYPAPGADPVPPLIAELAASSSLWQRRVAVLATFAAIKGGDAAPTLAIAEKLLDDREPLLHKAVGWMLREVGKRVDRAALTGFLDRFAARMPRTMLSYATEHLSPEARAAYRARR
ncbi:DNA alkylation repair protein [Agromyces soli]|uniref:DNA alkylation repair protein n=1 Tax=Agromyces soli TaxID=659012 RepID=A0ABY4AW06_9MICO|nr:DNA alkylation repair protein [Agromyces soli]UOE27371.1 DNA alkylation repair protein [Agromyces soli]